MKPIRRPGGTYKREYARSINMKEEQLSAKLIQFLFPAASEKAVVSASLIVVPMSSSSQLIFTLIIIMVFRSLSPLFGGTHGFASPNFSTTSPALPGFVYPAANCLS